MKKINSILFKAIKVFFMLSVLCGVLYTGVVTLAAQIFFPEQANGSMIEIDGKKYGSELLGQYYNDESHMWGRIMNIDVETFQDESGQPLMYAVPSNLSPASEEYKALVTERVEMMKAMHPGKSDAVPVDLVTCSGSGLDPHISKAAALYQVERLAKANHMSEEEIENIIEKCTTGRFLGIFGEETVNVLKVNLMIDKILK